MAAASRGEGDELVDADSRPMSLKFPARLTCAVAGIGLVCVGVYAIFRTDNQVGTAILIAAGVLFGLIGLSGQLPTRLKFGENEIVMPLVRAVERRITNGPPEESEAFASVVVNALSNNSGGADTDRRRTAILSELLVLQQIRDICRGHDGWGLRTDVNVAGHLDGILTTPQKEYGIEVKLYARPINTTAARAAVNTMTRSDVEELILITMYPVSPAVQGTIKPEVAALEPPRNIQFIPIGTEPQAWASNLEASLQALG